MILWEKFASRDLGNKMIKKKPNHKLYLVFSVSLLGLGWNLRESRPKWLMDRVTDGETRDKIKVCIVM